MRKAVVYRDLEEDTWVVDLIEDNELIESRYLYGYNEIYAHETAENWKDGILEIFCRDD